MLHRYPDWSWRTLVAGDEQRLLLLKGSMDWPIQNFLVLFDLNLYKGQAKSDYVAYTSSYSSLSS